jgi:hypothetical protein
MEKLKKSLNGLLEERNSKSKSIKPRDDKDLSTPSPTIPNEQKTTPKVIFSAKNPSP